MGGPTSWKNQSTKVRPADASPRCVPETRCRGRRCRSQQGRITCLQTLELRRDLLNDRQTTVIASPPGMPACLSRHSNPHVSRHGSIAPDGAGRLAAWVAAHTLRVLPDAAQALLSVRTACREARHDGGARGSRGELQGASGHDEGLRGAQKTSETNRGILTSDICQKHTQWDQESNDGV